MNVAEVNLQRAQELADLLPRLGYMRARVLPDGSVAAISDLAFTRAIYLGCTSEHWERRYCFANYALADRRFAELQSEDDVPAGHTAARILR
jgi:hypothetical protein